MLEYHLHSQQSVQNATTPYTPNNSPPNTIQTQIHHPYNSSCNYCLHSGKHTLGGYYYIYGEDSMSSSPPYESCYNKNNYFSTATEEEPYRYNYLLNLITAPDMIAYLSVAGFTDDIYALPLHLQRLICEAREELTLNTIEKSAQLRLERVRTLVWQRSDGDLYNLMNQLDQLISDEEEFEDLLRI